MEKKINRPPQAVPSQKGYVALKPSCLPYCQDLELFYSSNKRFVLFKKKGIEFDASTHKLGNEVLYYKSSDKAFFLEKMQAVLKYKIDNVVQSGDIEEIKSKICSLIEDVFQTPQDGNLHMLKGVVDGVLGAYAQDAKFLNNLALYSQKDYTTTVHVLNVMALVAGLCSRMEYNQKFINKISLAALLHDVGKLWMPDEVLKSQDKLSANQWELIKKHPLDGGEFLEQEGFSPQIISSALSHHEKPDGSGYPKGIKKVPEMARIIGLVDAFEAMTCDYRPYKERFSTEKTLTILLEDVLAGKYDQSVYVNLIKNLNLSKTTIFQILKNVKEKNLINADNQSTFIEIVNHFTTES